MNRAKNTLRLFAWFTLRHFKNHWGRSLAVLLGIGLGAAVFTSVRLAVHATLTSYTRSMARVVGESAVSVIRPGGRVPDHLVAPLLRHPAIAAASPVLMTYVRPAHSEAPFLLVGIEPVLDREFRGWTAGAENGVDGAIWATMMAEPGGLVIGRALAETFGWEKGEKVHLAHSRKTDRFTVLAVMDPEGLALAESGRIALCDIATFQEFTGTIGLADRIDLRFKKGAAVDAAAAVKDLLPPDVSLVASAEESRSGRGMIRAYELSLTFLSFISLFVGMFLVYSLVALNAASRRGEVAVMRAMGASRRLVFLLFVGEGACIGLFGFLAASPVSGFLVRGLLAGVSRTVSTLFVRVEVDTLFLSPWEILLSFALTVAVSMLAAIQPAREAMSVSPREAMDVAPAAAIRPEAVRRMAFTGVGFLLAVYPISRLPSPPHVSLSGYAASLFLFLGFALLAPWMLRRSGRLLSPVLLRVGGQPGFLAAGYLRQSGVQTAISVGALITAVALFTALVVMIHSFRSTVALWVKQSIAGDLYIRPKLDELNRHRDPLPSRVVEAVKGLTGPLERVPLRRLVLQVNGHEHTFEALDLAGYARRSRHIWMGGDLDRIEADLLNGKGVAVSEVFANRTGFKAGDRYRVEIGGKVLDAPIVGVFRDYRTRGGVVAFSLHHYAERFADPAWSGVELNMTQTGPEAEKSLDNARAALAACCGASIEMLDGPYLRRAILRIFDETFAITTVLLLIALVVAALGIATTLAVLVIQRSRQMNTIRAVGGSPGQLRRMIFWEAGLIAAVGEAAGLACGFVLSFLLIFVVNRQSFGWTFVYEVDGASILTALPLIFISALAAALPAMKIALGASPAALLRGGTS